MYNSQIVYNVIREQHEAVLALNDIAVTVTAESLAFYTAMLDAATHDPFDVEEEQEEIVEFFTNKIVELTEKYEILVNELI